MYKLRKIFRTVLRKAFVCLLLILLLADIPLKIAIAQEASASAEVPGPSPTSTLEEQNTSSDSATPSLAPATEIAPATRSATKESDLLPSLTPTPTDSVQPSLAQSPVAAPSAGLRPPLKMHKLSRRDFQVNEKLQIIAENAQIDDLAISVKNKEGKDLGVNYQMEAKDDGSVVVTLTPPVTMKTGVYTVEISDSVGQLTVQDFTWGVLAINTNKSIYLPHDKANFAFAVLNERGEMACDASLKLIVTGPTGTKTELTTDNKQITVGPDCSLKAYTPNPDFQAFYQVEDIGIYQLTLSAVTKNGIYEISDKFEVKDYVPFDVERIAPTRIYPPSTYPVQLSILAAQDFNGTVEEVVPDSFTIERSLLGLPFDSVKEISGADYSPNSNPESVISLRPPFNKDYKLTLGFGQNLTDPSLVGLYKKYNLRGHDGLDYALPEETPVSSTDDGVVVLAGDGDYGTTIVIQHPWGKSYYGHLSKLNVSVNQKVFRGETIGLSGHTGLVTAAHLHFGIKLNTNNLSNGYYGKIDPTPYLAFPLVTTDVPVKVISWKLSVHKGDKVTLGYQFQAPMSSPDLYRLWPLTFRNGLEPVSTVIPTEKQNEPFTLGVSTDSAMLADASSSGIVVTSGNPVENTPVKEQPMEKRYSSVVFQEARQWQIAADTVNVQIRQEINLLNGTFSSGTSLNYYPTTSAFVTYLDLTQYNGTITGYIEAIAKNTNATTAYNVNLYGQSSGNIVSVTVPANTAGYTRLRSSGFTPSRSEQITFSLQGTAVADQVTVQAVRLIIIQNAATLTSTETQIEIGNYETGKTNKTAAALTSPKYWTYTSANWDGVTTFYAEATYSTSTTQTATITLQEDDGSWANWTNMVTIVSAVSNTTPTRIRSAAFTPTATGRHYRISALESSNSGGRSYSIYNAKIIVDQGQIDSKVVPGNGNATFYGSGGTSEGSGGSFVASQTYSLTAVKVKLSKTASPTDNVYADIASSINGAALGTSGNISGSSLTTTLTDTRLTFATPISITSGNTYYVRLYRSGARDTNNYFSLGTSTNGANLGNSITLASGSWATSTSLDTRLYTYGSTFTLLEPQYLLLNTKSTATGLQSFNTLFDPAEWSGVTNTYEHAQDAIGATANSRLKDIDNANAILTNSSITGANQQIGSAITDMPTAAHKIDTDIVTVDTEIDASRILVLVTPQGTAALTGTATQSITETNVVSGSKTIIITLTNDTWVAAGATFDAQRQNIINGLTSAQSETTGWNNEVKAKQGVSGVVRTSATVVTITLDAQAAYNITSQETITATIPGSAVVKGQAIVATPTFTVDQVVVSGPTLDQLMRHGKWFNSGVKQPFTF